MIKQLSADIQQYVLKRWQRASPASVFASAFAVSITAFFYWIYFQLFLFVHDLFPERSPFALLTEEWRDQRTVIVRLAFELLTLGVLWRYLTPKKVYRYWQAQIHELPGLFPYTWKEFATIVVALSLLCGAVIGSVGFYHYKLKKPASQREVLSDDLSKKALEDFDGFKNEMKKRGVIISSPPRPCYEDPNSDHALTNLPQD